MRLGPLAQPAATERCHTPLAGAAMSQDRCSQAIAGVTTVLHDITQELHSTQSELQYWKVEADAWKCRYEQERARSERLRRMLRCTPSRDAGSTLTAQPSLRQYSSPRGSVGRDGGSFSCGGRQARHSDSQQPPAQQQQQQQQQQQSGLAIDTTSMPLPTVLPAEAVADSAAPAAARGRRHTRQPSWSHDGSTTIVAVAPAAAAAAAVQAPAPAPEAAAASQPGDALPDVFASYSNIELPGTPTVQDGGTSSSGTQQEQQRQVSSPADAGGITAAAATAAALAAPGQRMMARARTLPSRSYCGSDRAAASSVLTSQHTLGLESFSFSAPGAGRGSAGQQGRHTVDQLLSMMMAFTIMQGGGSQGVSDAGSEGAEEDALPTVSLDDDDGSSGVGLAAAAAVSAAMARAWASAASKEQRAVAAAAAASSGASGGGEGASSRAGFRLVATVTTKMGKRAPSSQQLSSSHSQDSLDSSGDLHGMQRAGSSSSLSQQQQQVPAADSAAAGSSPPAAGSKPGGVLAMNCSSGTSGMQLLPSASSGATKPPASPAAPGSGSGAAAEAAASAATAATRGAAGAAPNTGTATAICLHWLSRPRSVLVMRKLAPSTEAAFQRALEWLRRHHFTIWVEPAVYQALLDAGRLLPHAPAGSSGHLSSTLVAPVPLPNADGAAAGGTAAGQQQQQQQQQQPFALESASSWPSFKYSSSGSGSNMPAGQAAASGGIIRTWQPATCISQPQQPQQRDSGGGGGSAGGTDGWQSQASDLIPEAVAQQLDLVVVLGGDGTVLWTCHIFGNRSIPPLVPFNLGSLGFLTPFEPARLESVLLRTLRGGFPITLRHRLHCTIVRGANSPSLAASSAAADGMPRVGRTCVGTVCGEEHVALNEVVIERGISPFLTNLECFCDGTFVTHVQGDGLIVGTPTGSTAYSLAAGGSMVHPQVPCILFTPICPHSLSFRPLMFPDYCQLCVQVPLNSRSRVWASFDGKDRTELCAGDAVVIRLSKWPVPSVAAEADPSSDWFSAVRECLHWNLRKLQGGAGA